MTDANESTNPLPGYYAFVRREIQPLLPARADHALDVGCGQGGTLAWLKFSGIAARTTGIELDAAAAAIARSRVDRLIQGDAEAAFDALPAGSFDLVLCLDVLEHLVDPWRAMAKLTRALRPGGSVIISVPNVRHYSVALPLLWSGRWQYEEAGILDRTHLRFFTRASARGLLTGAGLELAGGIDTGLEPTRRRELWKPLLARSAWRDLGVFQFVLRGRKPVAPVPRAVSVPVTAAGIAP
jgi:SAM-dependent methyltransferase